MKKLQFRQFYRHEYFFSNWQLPVQNVLFLSFSYKNFDAMLSFIQLYFLGPYQEGNTEVDKFQVANCEHDYSPRFAVLIFIRTSALVKGS